MLAIELSTSSDCAREMRGTASIDSTVMGRRARSSTNSGLNIGCRIAISVAPSRSRFSSEEVGALTPSTMSAPSASPIAAPDATYCSSAKLASAPAPDSTTTS